MKDADSAPQQHHHSHDVELGKTGGSTVGKDKSNEAVTVLTDEQAEEIMAQLNDIDRKLQEFEDKKNELKEKYEALRDADLDIKTVGTNSRRGRKAKTKRCRARCR